MNKKKRKWSKTKKVIVSLIAVMVVLVGTVLGFYQHVKNKIYIENSSSSKSSTDFEEVEGITNALLIGVDARDLDESCRSDSMIIATIDNNNKNVKLTSLFRDTLVDIPGHGEAKLNYAYMAGGADLLMDTIKETYNINIDKYIVINFWGFEAIVDQIGGIEIDVKDYQLEELNKYIGESTGGNDCPVENAGLQLLNGKQALSYARIRYNVGDEYERTDRQREVIFKVVEKLQETKPSKYLGIMNKMLEYIKTNIDPFEALNMAYTIYKFPSLEMQQLQIPLVALSETRNYKDLGSVFLMDRLQNANILYNFIYENKIPNEDEFDFESLRLALQSYADQESIYNQMYNINPNDYVETQDGEVTKYDESIYEPSEPIYTPQENINIAPSGSEDDGQESSNQAPVTSPSTPETNPSEGSGEADNSEQDNQDSTNTEAGSTENTENVDNQTNEIEGN